MLTKRLSELTLDELVESNSKLPPSEAIGVSAEGEQLRQRRNSIDRPIEPEKFG
jgi:hypothetical protein